MTKRLSEAEKELSRQRERARKHQYYIMHYKPRHDDRRRCAICNALMYGRGTAHVQCLVHQEESQVPENPQADVQRILSTSQP